MPSCLRELMRVQLKLRGIHVGTFTDAAAVCGWHDLSVFGGSLLQIKITIVLFECEFLS